MSRSKSYLWVDLLACIRQLTCSRAFDSDGVTTRAELVESMLEVELVLHEAAVEKKSSTIDVDLDEWRTEGHEYIDKRIRRPIKGAFGRIVTYSEARIVGWLPAEESDYTNQAGEAAALWHLLWNDGAEEDLEEWEVQESLALSRDVDVDMVSPLPRLPHMLSRLTFSLSTP